jgi:anti-sigma B factor antagonist
MWSPSMSVVPQLLTVSAVPDREQVRVVAAGELDPSTADELGAHLAALLDAGAWHDVVVDLREVAFMDTSGVHALLDAGRRARDEGVTLVVVVEPGPVKEVLRLTAADRVLTVAASDGAERSDRHSRSR